MERKRSLSAAQMWAPISDVDVVDRGRCEPKKVGTVLPLQPSIYCWNWRGCITSKIQNVLHDLKRMGLFFLPQHPSGQFYPHLQQTQSRDGYPPNVLHPWERLSAPIAGRGGARLRVCAAQCRHSPPAVTGRSLYGRVQSVCAGGLTEGRERDVEGRDKGCKCVWGGGGGGRHCIVGCITQQHVQKGRWMREMRGVALWWYGEVL